MPLVRLELRNEYSLGAPELYREADMDDSKKILEGVAVTGLVGLLRQLGDLAEFAADVFHGLQEEVMITSSRSRKLMGRVKRIEAAVSPLEKALLAQRSHLHFAYTAGSDWLACIQCEQNHFVYEDVPQFIVDSYEDCRGPPDLHLLDRFDAGGPGSCLKRYSDPTFFKRASAASGDVSIEKIPKARTSSKIKKRKSRPRNQGVSSTSHRDSMQFAKDAGGNTFPSQTMSTHNSTLRSDFSEHSNLDLNNGSGYIEGDFCRSYSIQPEELEFRSSISSPAKRCDNDFLDHSFLEVKVTGACEGIQTNLAQKQGGHSSSSVTWNENTETVDPTRQDYDHSDMTVEDDHDRNTVSSSEKLDRETLNDNAVRFEIVDKIDAQTFSQDLPTFTSSVDIESETDQFMDALNTIESESETDIDCTTKKEDHYSEFNDEIVQDGLQELMKQNPERQTSMSESNTFANFSSIDGSSGKKPILVSSKPPSAACDSVSEVAAQDEFASGSLVEDGLLSAKEGGRYSNTENHQLIDSLENGNISAGANLESVSCPVSSSFRDNRLGDPIIDGTRSSTQSQKPAPETSNVASFTFWSNGSLLGLQPSKPPDCCVLNYLPQDPVSVINGKSSSSRQHLVLSDEAAGKPAMPKNFKNIDEDLDLKSSRFDENQESGTSFRKLSWKISPGDLDIKLGKFGNILHPSHASSTGDSVTECGNFLPVNRLFPTSSYKTLLPGGYEHPRLASCQNVNSLEQRNHQNVVDQTISEQNKESLITSPSSSPPLEHMKISFHPTDGFETSKLKLKFSSGDFNVQSSRDMFPSFQLVPEVYSTHTVGSDSDADTFYKASPPLSDDCCSHHLESDSEPDSEQWEPGGSPSSKDHLDLHDCLRRISFTESILTVPQDGRTDPGDNHDNCDIQSPYTENSTKNSLSCHLFDIQNWETEKFREDVRNYSNSKNLVEPQSSPTPATPLPPVHLQGTKPHLDYVEDKCEATPEGSKHSASTISQQPKPAPSDNNQIPKPANVEKNKQFGVHKSNGRIEASQSKSIGENDFLHQIRAKSFNLRRTVTAKPTVPSGCLANVKVAALLEKANAIRKAVGSDDEDDGNWSDA